MAIVAVTGATGHIGLNLCQNFAEEGYSVRALIHRNDIDLHHPRIDKIKGDILDKQSLKPFIQGAEIVIHLAAKISIQGDPDGSVHRINVDGTRNVLDICREAGVNKVIHFSSIHAYSPYPLDRVIDETAPLDDFPGSFAYNRTKALGQRLALQAASEGLPVVVINPTAVVGPNDYQPSFLGSALINMYNRKLPALVKGGFNWVDVRDIVDGTKKAIEKGKPGECYILGGHWASVGELSQMIARLFHVKPTTIALPITIAKMGVPFAWLVSKLTGKPPLYTMESLEALRQYRYISIEKAKKSLGYQPRPLEETIKDTILWFKQQGML